MNKIDIFFKKDKILKKILILLFLLFVNLFF